MVRPSPCVANWHQSDAALSFHVPRSICGKARSHLSRMMAQHCNAPAGPASDYRREAPKEIGQRPMRKLQSCATALPSIFHHPSHRSDVR